jgi:hypothetical protein
MDRVDQGARLRGRFVWLALLVAWTIVAGWAFAVLTPARTALLNGLHQLPVSHERGVLRGWTVSLKFCQLLLVVLVLLAIWAAVLLFRRRPHPRQWATILVAVVLVAIGWFLFAGFGAPLSEARRWLSPEAAFAAQLSVAAGALLLLVLAFLRIRRAPEPLDQQQDRYAIADYTQLNKPSAPRGSAALAEARARAESVLPVDEGDEPAR